MEIERKFWLSAMPDLPEIAHMDQWQGYLSVSPEVRIRRTIHHTTGAVNHILCIKSTGQLERHEVETPITPQQFDELASMLDRPLIHKDLRAFRLPDGYVLECSVVDDGVFSYGEVEFPTREQALSWIPPPWLGQELTWQNTFKMSTYWSNRRVPSLSDH